MCIYAHRKHATGYINISKDNSAYLYVWGILQVLFTLYLYVSLCIIYSFVKILFCFHF